ncbi:MAG: site-specific integrase [Eubacterium sp.]|nr:site-specific integrase [Eubacterium sp.]
MQRRDKKGRLLRIGEYQRSNGKYLYRYIENGKPKYAYSWTLVETDRTPPGKKTDKALRIKEAEIEQRLSRHLVPGSEKMTVEELLDAFIGYKSKALRPTSERNYRSEKNRIARTSIYKRPIQNITILQCKSWIFELADLGVSFDTVRKTHTLLRQAMDMAYENDWIVKNPCLFKLSSVLKKTESKIRYPLNDEWKKKYLDFIKESNEYSFYYDAIFILCNTGLRISELCGLTKKDIDFDRGFIDVTKQLLPAEKNGRYLQTTKTTNGVRKIPITDNVRRLLEKRIEGIRRRGHNPKVEGEKDFIFLSKSETLMDSRCWNKIFTRIYRLFIAEYPDYEKQDEYSKITPHVLRHTFCTDLVKAHVDEKTIISIVGHSSYVTTLKIYTHYDFAKISEDFLSKMNEG